jgi:hypothetical protein
VLEARRTTRDADMLARGISSDEDSVRAVVGEIAKIAMDDGAIFNTGEITTRDIREHADYQSLRVTLPAALGTARLKLQLDLSFGDPVNPQLIYYPTLLDDPDFQLLGYPVENVIAEKVETMIFLSDANTRDRDWGDVFLLSRMHAFDADRLRAMLRTVATHRGRSLRPLEEVLQTLPADRQQPWEAFRARAGLPGLPERFADAVAEVIAFVDPLLGNDEISRWNPAQQRWE